MKFETAMEHLEPNEKQEEILTILVKAHFDMMLNGFTSYELGPYATRDIVQEMRKDIGVLIDWIADGSDQESQDVAKIWRAKYPKDGRAGTTSS